MSWLVVKTKHKSEQKAMLNMERQGFTTFLPMIDVEKITRGKKVKVQEPLFPGYLFTKYDEHCQLYQAKIRSTFGVTQVVSFGQEPAKAHDSIIESIKNKLVVTPETPVFNAGDAVVVKSGPFSGVDGIFECSTGDERAIILLRILENQTRMELGFDEFEGKGN